MKSAICRFAGHVTHRHEAHTNATTEAFRAGVDQDRACQEHASEELEMQVRRTFDA
jgi:hypothetical protein